MYQVGEFVVYGSEGVCEVQEIGTIDILGLNNNREYYTLKPINNNGKIFAPIDTNVFIRGVLTGDEIQEMIKEIPSLKKSTDKVKNDRALQEYYKNLLKTDNFIELLSTTIEINNEKEELGKNGKKLGQIQEKFIKIANDLIEDEFSIVLGINKEDVSEYIKDKLNI